MRLFQGYEAEGRYKGVKTLFVSGDVPWERIEFFLIHNVSYTQVYFGADHCSTINWGSIEEAIACSMVDIVTVEIGDNNYPYKIPISSKLHFVLNLNKLTISEVQMLLVSIRLPNQIQIKFDSEKCTYVGPYTAFMCNVKSDIDADTELWRQDEAPLKR